jgi:hypothetical protein
MSGRPRPLLFLGHSEDNEKQKNALSTARSKNTINSARVHNAHTIPNSTGELFQQLNYSKRNSMHTDHQEQQQQQLVAAASASGLHAR